MNKKFWYEMRLRPIGIGCQPKGMIEFNEDKGNWGIVAYDRELTDKELDDFDMLKWKK